MSEAVTRLLHKLKGERAALGEELISTAVPYEKYLEMVARAQQIKQDSDTIREFFKGGEDTDG